MYTVAKVFLIIIMSLLYVSRGFSCNAKPEIAIVDEVTPLHYNHSPPPSTNGVAS